MMQFSKELRSILPVGDITECIPDEVADVAVLEEPEHLNWYHHGRKWKNKFRRVIGVVHTNYIAYVKREKNGQAIACFMKYMNTWVTRIYCHKVTSTPYITTVKILRIMVINLRMHFAHLIYVPILHGVLMEMKNTRDMSFQIFLSECIWLFWLMLYYIFIEFEEPQTPIIIMSLLKHAILTFVDFRTDYQIVRCHPRSSQICCVQCPWRESKIS